MFKRLSAIFIALIMCLSLMTPAMAAIDPSSTATITIENVEAGSELNAYQIIAPVIDSKGNFVGWKWADSIESASKSNEALATMITNSTTAVDVEVTSGDTTVTKTFNLITKDGITLANVQTIMAQGVSVLGNPTITMASETDPNGFTYNSSDKTYTASATAGSYLVYAAPVTGAIKIYNPMVVSVNYSGNSVTGGTVDAGTADNKSILEIGGSEAYAKSSEVKVDKGANRTSASLGETVSYSVANTIPQYDPKTYTSVVYTFTDELSNGLSYVEDPTTNSIDLTVKLNGTEIDPGDTTYKVTSYTQTVTEPTESIKGGSFTVTFAPAFILDENNKFGNLTFEYSATINENATTGFDPNTNTATITYSNKPGTDADGNPYTDTTTDKFDEFTFSINGSITGNTEIVGTKTQVNFVKTGDQTRTSETTIQTKNEPVSGAEFALYVDNNGAPGGNPIRTGTTDNLGLFTMDQLGVGTYWLVETVAPAGYVINSTPVKVVIQADIQNDVLNSYTITIGNNGEENSTKYELVLNSTTQKYEIETTYGSDNDPGFYEFICISRINATT